MHKEYRIGDANSLWQGTTVTVAAWATRSRITGESSPTPYKVPTTVEEAIGRIPSWGNASSVAISPLPGGITNFNYRVDVGGEAFHLRIWAAEAALLGIDRMREHRCAVTASRCGVAPEVVHFLPDAGITVTRFVPGRPLQPGIAPAADALARVVRSMRRYHDGLNFGTTRRPHTLVELFYQPDE